jgi:hypothetical protein
MANTVIQLKWSEATAAPTTLNVAEPAYSNTSGKLFIGRTTGGPVVVGGSYYTGVIDAATSANTGNTIMKRDAAGGLSATYIYASLFGNANTATSAAAWTTARTIGVSGDANGTVSIDGSANANIPLTLGNSGVAAGSYGSVTQIPTFSVDAKGRVTSAANVSISTSLNTAADTGTDTVALATDTLTFKGGDGITTNMVAANTTVMIDVDNTVMRSTGGTINGDLAITGNLVISGNTITQDVETLKVEDSLIQLAANNAADAVDIGFFGQYNDGTTKYTALFRDASDSGKYKLLTGGTTVPSAANSVDPSTYSTATLVANITGGTVSGLTSDISVADGGTGAGTFTGGAILIGNGTGALQTLANSTLTGTGTLAVANTITSLTADAYGRFTAFTSQAIAIDTAQITSGTLPLARGGTNQTSYTAGQRLVYDGTSLSSQANTSTTVTGGLAAANTITSLTYNSYGELTAFTGAAIAIDTSQITSGTLGVARGGSGAASFTVKGVIVSDSASTTGALTALTSSTEGHVLQINASGVPSFAYLSGGTF